MCTKLDWLIFGYSPNKYNISVVFDVELLQLWGAADKVLERESVEKLKSVDKSISTLSLSSRQSMQTP